MSQVPRPYLHKTRCSEDSSTLCLLGVTGVSHKTPTHITQTEGALRSPRLKVTYVDPASHLKCFTNFSLTCTTGHSGKDCRCWGLLPCSSHFSSSQDPSGFPLAAASAPSWRGTAKIPGPAQPAMQDWLCGRSTASSHCHWEAAKEV